MPVQRFLDTGGREGIPVLLIGGQKRIPRQKLEPLAGGPILSTFLVHAGFDVREVNPARTSDRRRRRRKPKTDREDALAIAREVLADPKLPPVPAAAPLSEVHAELAVVVERRRSLVRRRQRLLNESEMALAKLPLTVRQLLPGGTVRTRLRALAGLTIDDVSPSTAEVVGWLLESWSDLQLWETGSRISSSACPACCKPAAPPSPPRLGSVSSEPRSWLPRSATPAGSRPRVPSPDGPVSLLSPLPPGKAWVSRSATVSTCKGTGP